MSRSRRTLPPALALIAALLAGCGGSADTDTASSGGAAASSSAAASSAESSSAPAGEGSGADSGEPFPANTDADLADASADARVTVSDIRVARQDGFDRVVFEVGGTGTPGWDVRYVDQASSQGSGNAIDVAGNAVLQVTITGAGYPYDTGVEEYAGSDPLAAAGTESVTEVVFDATFEGTTVAFIGTTAQAPFRVYPLADPTRIVIEVADS